MILMKDTQAYVFSRLAYEQAVEALSLSSEPIENLEWVDLSGKSWITTGGKAPKVSYRLSDSADVVKLQVKVKGGSSTYEEVFISLNSPFTDDTIFGGYSEKNPVKNFMSENVKSNSAVKHYFDEEGNEFFEMEINKPEQLKSYYRGRFSLQVNSDGGFYKVGGAYAPNAYQLILPAPKEMETINVVQNTQLAELYTSVTCFMADGLSLSTYIKYRRQKSGFEDNIRFLETLLSKNVANISSVNILSSLFLEKIEMDLHHKRYSDQRLLATATQSRQFAMSAGMKKEWIDYALTCMTIDILDDHNHFCGPDEIRFKNGGESVRIPLDGQTQVIANSSGVVVLPVGLFVERPMAKLQEVEFHYNHDFTSPLGVVKLLTGDKIIDLIDAEGKLKSDMLATSMNNAISPFVLYEDGGVKNTYKIKKDHKIAFKEFVLPSLTGDYNWTEDALLQNIKLNPINEYIATDLLRKWLSMKQVKDEAFADVCVDILSHSPDNYRLVQGVVRIFMEKFNNLDQVTEIMKKARVTRDSRRRVFLGMNDMKKWYTLGPLYTSTNQQSPLEFKPSPHKVIISPKREFADNESKIHIFEKGRKLDRRGDGVIYYWTPLVSERSSKLFLHLKTNEGDNYGAVSIWVNGKVAYEGYLREYDSNLMSIPVELKQGGNYILVKYDFNKSVALDMMLGDVYGAPVPNVVVGD
jgi:hypothetical protein